MPTFRDVTDSATGVTVADVMTGSVYKRLDHPSLVRIGLAAELVLATGRVTIGSRVITEVYGMPVEGVAGAGVDVGRDVQIIAPGFAGEEIIISTTNGNAAANEITTYVFYP